MPRCSTSRPTSAPRARCIALAAAHEVRERRAQARHPAYAAPELVATGPNQVWSWDITKLKGPVPALCDPRPLQPPSWAGWSRATRMRTWPSACWRRPAPGHHAAPTHHSRGPRCAHAAHSSRCSSRTWVASHSRPRVQRNPFSEAQFRTVKYRPEFPARFGALEHARGVSRDLFAWYNDAHHQRPELSDARRRPLRPRRNGPGGPSPHTPGRLCRPSRAVRATRVTIPTAVWINRPPTLTSQVSHDHRHPGRPTAGCARTHRQSPGTLVTSVESLQ